MPLSERHFFCCIMRHYIGLVASGYTMDYFDVLATFTSFGGLSVQAITDDRWGVEGIYSQQFSVGIFFFLMICIVFFTIIVIKFMSTGPKTNASGTTTKRLKTGEKVMFLAIFLGIFAAVVMAVMQLLQGYLF